MAWQPKIEVDFFQVETNGVTVRGGSSWKARKVMRPERGVVEARTLKHLSWRGFFLRNWVMGMQETPFEG